MSTYLIHDIMHGIKRIRMRSFITLAAKLLLGYVIILALMYVYQSKLVYFPYGIIDKTPKNIYLEYESIYIKSTDNTKIHAWYIPKNGAKTTIFFLHGNGGNLSHRTEYIRLFNSIGLNVFIFDYRGYGNSSGEVNEQNTYDDAKLAWEYLLNNKGTKPENIVILGRSLGGAIAAKLGSEVRPKALILDSTFTTIKEFASYAYPFVPLSLVRFNYETTKYLKNINYPVLVIHSTEDNIVPFKFGKAVFENANQPKYFLQIKGNHNFGFLESEKIYLNGIDRFIKAILPNPYTQNPVHLQPLH